MVCLCDFASQFSGILCMQDLVEREHCNQDAIEEERAGLMKLKEVGHTIHDCSFNTC